MFNEAPDVVARLLQAPPIRAGTPEGPQRSEGAAQPLDAPTASRHSPQARPDRQPRPIKYLENHTIDYHEHAHHSVIVWNVPLQHAWAVVLKRFFEYCQSCWVCEKIRIRIGCGTYGTYLSVVR